jgi:CheY-like chemotaxis protein
VSTVLVVDDAADLRLLVRTVLTRAGFVVTDAESGAEALRMLHDERLPDLVVLDVQMPDLDGWDTLAALRRRPDGADVAVILLTVKSSEDDTLRAWRLGCDGFLTKPFSIASLSALASDVVALRPIDRLALRASAAAAADSGAATRKH